ncbi:MAG: TonB-dependent receptor [Pseudomonadales bacterium]|nr:TonB-dependent receptor [Pseudomonadales bacterium]
MNLLGKCSRWLFLGCYCCFQATIAHGQAADTGQAAEDQQIQTYQRDYFNQYNPQTAWDIIDRLPGFTMDTGEEDLRGFGATAGNVLIDGERPSTKTGGIEDALNRLPANLIERVEVIRGVAGNSEAAGQAVVANLIRIPQATSASWESQVEQADDNTVYSSAELTWAAPLAGWETSTKANVFWERWPLSGPRYTRDAAGDVLIGQFENRPSTLQEAFLSSEFRRSLGVGELGLTGRWGRSEFLPNTERLGYDGRLADLSEIPDERFSIDLDSKFNEAELGIDWSRPIAENWDWKLLSLTSGQNWTQVQLVGTERPIGITSSASNFTRRREQLESVLRNTVTYEGERSLVPEFGFELTYNNVDNLLSLSSQDSDGNVSIISLPGADTTVEERRAEAFFNLIWSIDDRFSLETGAAFETSEIQVSGDASNEQSFFFAKPYVNLIMDYSEGLQFRAGVRRRIGQLSFSEFAASAQADADRLLAGNPAIRPDQVVRASFITDYRRESGLAVNVELFHEWRDDVLEQVVLPSGIPGTGNAGEAEVSGITSSITLPLRSFIPGGLLEIEAEVLDSSFTDPITGRNRVVSGLNTPNIFIDFRQDLLSRRISWGVSYLAETENTFFFADEETFSRDGDQWRVYVETTRFAGIRTRFTLRNIGARSLFQVRRFFRPTRADEFTGTEIIDRERGMFMTLTLSGQF